MFEVFYTDLLFSEHVLFFCLKTNTNYCNSQSFKEKMRYWRMYVTRVFFLVHCKGTEILILYSLQYLYIYLSLPSTNIMRCSWTFRRPDKWVWWIKTKWNTTPFVIKYTSSLSPPPFCIKDVKFCSLRLLISFISKAKFVPSFVTHWHLHPMALNLFCHPLSKNYFRKTFQFHL